MLNTIITARRTSARGCGARTVKSKSFAAAWSCLLYTSYSASAIIKISVDGKSEITAAEGDGPVHALDRALRKALEVFYPVVKTLRLIDYKVRVLDPDTGTAALTRVLMTTTDGKAVWSTVGVSRDILEASWNALADSVEICLLQEADRKHARTVATAAEI